MLLSTTRLAISGSDLLAAILCCQAFGRAQPSCLFSREQLMLETLFRCLPFRFGFRTQTAGFGAALVQSFDGCLLVSVQRSAISGQPVRSGPTLSAAALVSPARGG